MNNFSLIGRISKEITLSRAGGGFIVGFGSICYNESFKTKSGEWTQKAHFFEFKAFGKTAEQMELNARKGASVLLTGKLVHDQYTTKKGEQINKMVLVVEDFEILAKKEKAQAGERIYNDNGYQTPVYNDSESVPVYQEPSVFVAGSVPDEDVPNYQDSVNDDIPF